MCKMGRGVVRSRLEIYVQDVLRHANVLDATMVREAFN
jgi:hypothetical protein